MFLFENGDEIKDKVTGIKGIVRGRADYLTGCNRYAIQQLKKDERKDWVWYDEPELELVKKGKIKLYDEKKDIPRHTGGAS